LKEWAVTVRALELGEQVVLLRKGGIAEKARRFKPHHQDFLLFPTFEHQNPESLKDRYHPLLKETLRYSSKESIVPISSWAHVEKTLPIHALQRLLRISDEHIWSEEEVKGRYQWKPERPLYLLLLRVHRLPETVELDLLRQYGGCRSWIEVVEPVAVEGSEPVLDDEAFAERAKRVEEHVGG
jgi:hypothetical protein